MNENDDWKQIHSKSFGGNSSEWSNLISKTGDNGSNNILLQTGFLSVGEKLHNSNSESAREHGLVNKVEYWNDDIKTINKGGKLEVGDTILAKWKPSNEGHTSPDSTWYMAQIIDFVHNNNVRVCWQDADRGNTDIKNYKNILYAPNLNM